jgi:hypothetical protein
VRALRQATAYRSGVRVLTGKVEEREAGEAVVSLDDGSTRRLRVPETVEVAPGTSVRIIEPSEPDRPTFVGWGEGERVAERERQHGYVRAGLTLLPTDEGGRKGPFASGYRPQWDLGDRTEDGAIVFSDAEVWLEDELTLSPGDAAVVRLHPSFPEFWRGVCEGSLLGLYEGNRRLGDAHVLEVVAPDDSPPKRPPAQAG